MNSETRELLNAIQVYVEILNGINVKLRNLIGKNTDNAMYEIEHLFYEICSDLMRVIPVRTYNGNMVLDLKSGILLLRDKIPFLEKEYSNLLEKEKYKDFLLSISFVRNKFIHEPHKLCASYSVGGSNSCFMGLYYEESLRTISTMEMIYLITELNLVYAKLKDFYVDLVYKQEAEYRSYPCFWKMLEMDFIKYNDEYPTIPICYLFNFIENENMLSVE